MRKKIENYNSSILSQIKYCMILNFPNCIKIFPKFRLGNFVTNCDTLKLRATGKNDFKR